MPPDFTRSRLVRLLQGLAPAEADAPGLDTAERLGLWVDPFDAMALHAAHEAVQAFEAPAPKGAPAARAGLALDAQLHQVRTVLAQAVQAPAPEAEAGEAGPDYGPYRQRHAELQRNMELMIGPLREHARQTLAQASRPLRQLAALDAAWESLLAEREQRLLAKLPQRLEQRFQQQRQAHRQEPDPLGWLGAFGEEWRQAVLAELELRLEPVAGLVEAFGPPGERSP